MIDLSKEGRHIARKTYRCDHCGRLIEPGTQYLRQFNVDGGDSWSFRSHIDCHDLACVMAGPDGYIEGVPILHQSWSEGGMDGIDTPYNRGHFPHAVNRMDFLEQTMGGAGV